MTVMVMVLRMVMVTVMVLRMVLVTEMLLLKVMMTMLTLGMMSMMMGVTIISTSPAITMTFDNDGDNDLWYPLWFRNA